MRATRQPQYITSINRQNRFGRTVDAAFSFGGSVIDLVSRNRPSTNTATTGATGSGRALRFSGAQSFLFTKDNAYSGPYMVVAVAQADSTAGGVGNIASGSENGVGYSWQLRQNGSSWEFYHFDGSADVLAGDSGGVTSKKPTVLIALWDGANIKLFRDGVLKATTAASAQPRPINRVSLGYDGASGGQFFSGDVNDVYFLRGTFSTNDALELSKNVYQALQAPTRRVRFAPSAGGGDVSVALTGSAMTASAGTLLPTTDKALSGSSASASAGTVSPATNTALAGSAATAAPGTLVATPTFGLSGEEMAAAPGDVVQSRTVPLTGEALMGAQGDVGVVGDVTVALTGQAMTMAQGLLARAADAAESYSGGFFEVPNVPRRRSVREERERLGIFPREVKQIVLAVARASVVADKTDDQAARQLAQRLAQQDIEAKARYVEFMQQERDRILARDIERALRIRQRQYELDEDDREAEMLLM